MKSGVEILKQICGNRIVPRADNRVQLFQSCDRVGRKSKWKMFVLLTFPESNVVERVLRKVCQKVEMLNYPSSKVFDNWR